MAAAEAAAMGGAGERLLELLRALARELRERAGALARTPLAPLARGFSRPHDVVTAWRTHWTRLWPEGHTGREPLELLLRATSRQRRQLLERPQASRLHVRGHAAVAGGCSRLKADCSRCDET